MSTAQHRTSQTEGENRHGIVRVEVQAPAADAGWIRKLAKILRSDTAQSVNVRNQLREAVQEPDELGLKELLASAPLEGIDLRRSRDTGRDVDL